jgi:hypothetical protein
MRGHSGSAASCHGWTAPSWQEHSSRLQHWSVQPCVRPVCAVHMTAGHNALRGSGPGQKSAFDDALARVGCPDRRIGAAPRFRSNAGECHSAVRGQIWCPVSNRGRCLSRRCAARRPAVPIKKLPLMFCSISTTRQWGGARGLPLAQLFSLCPPVARARSTHQLAAAAAPR